jgi:Flp pilus assembly protein TadD
MGVALFLLSLAVGLYRSFMTRQGMPSIGIEYLTELDEVIEQQGHTAALPHVRSAARIDFDSEVAVNKLLETARQAGDADTALWALVTMVRLQPEDGALRSELISELLARGRGVEAFTHAEFAVRLRPNSARTLSDLGAVLLELGQQRDAAAVYRRVLELDPTSKKARHALEFPLRGF